MTDGRTAAVGAPPASGQACWSRIGVGGDRTCPELATQIHCRNCPVYSAGAMAALDVEIPADYVAAWSGHFAQAQTVTEPHTESVVIFRVATEWFALPASAVTEVANVLPVHTLPHRSDPAILGIVNVRGSLVTCVSLRHLLGAATQSSPKAGIDQGGGCRRLLVIRWGQVRAVCPVDEVHGVHRLRPQELREVPATFSKAAMTFSTSLLLWRDHSVGMLDADRVCEAIMRSLS